MPRPIDELAAPGSATCRATAGLIAADAVRGGAGVSFQLVATGLRDADDRRCGKFGRVAHHHFGSVRRHRHPDRHDAGPVRAAGVANRRHRHAVRHLARHHPALAAAAHRARTGRAPLGRGSAWRHRIGPDISAPVPKVTSWNGGGPFPRRVPWSGEALFSRSQRSDAGCPPQPVSITVTRTSPRPNPPPSRTSAALPGVSGPV